MFPTDGAAGFTVDCQGSIRGLAAASAGGAAAAIACSRRQQPAPLQPALRGCSQTLRRLYFCHCRGWGRVGSRWALAGLLKEPEIPITVVMPCTCLANRHRLANIMWWMNSIEHEVPWTGAPLAAGVGRRWSEIIINCAITSLSSQHAI